ncbi:MAG: hypothetical protein J6W06_04865 [Bacteroidales bacterium]|nr:hypothetical protein [Bacteroidales bacterium]
MEKNIYDNLKKGIYHSAVLTSFSFNLSYFDNQILKTLRQKDIRSICLFVDQNQLDNGVIFDCATEKIGKWYSVSGIPSKGAFHPKLKFFIGNKNIALMFGSGNISHGGDGYNHEVFSGLMASDSDKVHLPLIREAWEYFLGYMQNTAGYVKERITKDVIDNCELLKQNIKFSKHEFVKINDDVDVALLYNEDNDNIFNQLSNLLPVKDIEEITIVSPFFDEDGIALKNILDLCHNAKRMDVFIQECCVLPPRDMKTDIRVNFYDFNKTKQGHSGKDKILHAKIFIFKSKSKEYCMIGSANATIAAMGDLRKATNDEFCGLFRCNMKDYSLKKLDIDEKIPINWNIHDMIRISKVDKNANKSTIYPIRIKSIDYNSDQGKYFLFIDGNCQEGTKLWGVNYGGDEVEIGNLKFDGKDVLCTSSKEESLLYCFIKNDSGIISNKQYVNYCHELMLTHPSKMGEMLSKIIYDCENGIINSVLVTEYIYNIYKDLLDDESISSQKYSGLANNTNSQNHKNPVLKFGSGKEIKDEIQIKIETENAISSRFLDCILKAIRLDINRIEDNNMSEEESVSIDAANGVAFSDDKYKSVSKKDANKIKDNLKKIIYSTLKWFYERKNKKDIKLSCRDVEYFLLTTTAILFHSCLRYKFIDDENLKSYLSQINEKDLKSIVDMFIYMNSSCLDNNANAINDLYMYRDRVESHIALIVYLYKRKLGVKYETYKDDVYLMIVNMINIWGQPDEKCIYDYLQGFMSKTDSICRCENVIKEFISLCEKAQLFKDFVLDKKGAYGIYLVKSGHPRTMRDICIKYI